MYKRKDEKKGGGWGGGTKARSEDIGGNRFLPSPSDPAYSVLLTPPLRTPATQTITTQKLRVLTVNCFWADSSTVSSLFCPRRIQVTTYTNTPHPSFSADLKNKRKEVLVKIKFEGLVHCYHIHSQASPWQKGGRGYFSSQGKVTNGKDTPLNGWSVEEQEISRHGGQTSSGINVTNLSSH